MRYQHILRRLITVGVLLVLIPGTSLWAQESTGEQKKIHDVEEIDLSELLNIEVVTGTKTSKKISEAPVIIGVYTGNEIASFGVDNLYELLSTLPGIEVMETYYGYTVIQFRGILQSHYNNKSCLLLNGQPLYDQVVSSYYLEQIPVSCIERIEIVRGAGGVLYGTNAYAGVINIITKKGKEVDGAMSSFRMGSFNTKALRFVMGKEINDLDIFFAGEFNESDGYKKEVTWDEDDIYPPSLLYGNGNGSRIMGYYSDDTDAYENDYKNFFTSLGYKNLVLNAIYFENEKDKFGIVPTLASTGERKLQGFGLNLKYSSKLLGDKMELSGIVWYDRIKKNERVNAYPPVLHSPNHQDEQEYTGYKSGLQLEMNYAISERLALLAGLGSEFSHVSPYLYYLTDSIHDKIQDKPANAFPFAHNTNDIWAFFQANYTPLKKVSLLAGGRYNKNQQAGDVFIPSLGVVYTATHRLTFKLLYGAGFRNPSFFEKYVRTVNILAGVEDLQPETIQTVDIGINYTLDKYSFHLNGFYNKTAKLIGRRALTNSDIMALNHEPDYGEGEMKWTKGGIYENGEGQQYLGVEFSVQGSPSSFLSFRGNISYKEGESDSGKELMYFSPWLANVGVILKPSKKFSLSATYKYVGRVKVNYASQYPWNLWPNEAQGGTNDTIAAYSLINMGITYHLRKGIIISLIGKNITNKDYVYPEYVRHAIPYIPGGPGRSLYVSVSYKF